MVCLSHRLVPPPASPLWKMEERGFFLFVLDASGWASGEGSKGGEARVGNTEEGVEKGATVLY